LWAKTLLIVGFCSYVTAACVIWEFNVNVQYYFLLALFISIYLINSNEKLWLTCCLAFQLIGFIGFSFSLPILGTPQVELLAIAQTNSIIFAVSCCICALFIRAILSRNWHVMRAYEAQQKQLINQVFPKQMGRELINHKTHTQQGHLFQHKHMAILFLDICDFTKDILLVNNSWQRTYALFARFDELIKHLDTKRIKTNGDQYIVVVGLQNTQLSNEEIAEQALTASILIAKYCKKSSSIQVRQGLSFGDIIYGIFDTNAPVFDVWGKTVVTAARLESIANASSIVVDKCLFSMTQTQFNYGPCIKVDLKGIGATDTYTLQV
jgi:adenylate cyclase